MLVLLCWCLILFGCGCVALFDGGFGRILLGCLCSFVVCLLLFFILLFSVS